MIPEQITYISVYLMFSKARLIDTLLPQILPFGANAFGIFLLRQSFRQINPEVFEAARMDDAGEWNHAEGGAAHVSVLPDRDDDVFGHRNLELLLLAAGHDEQR